MAKTITDLLDGFKGLPEKLDANISTALRMAAELSANEAKSNHAHVDRSGALTAGVGAVGPSGTFSGGDLQATVGGGAGYTKYVELGTLPHVIRPKHRKALRVPVEGGFKFFGAVKHPGTKATYFIRNAVESGMKTLTGQLIPDAVELSLAESGLA